MSFRHIIFDCDGVLVDSEPLSMRVDVAILAENGVRISEHEAHARFVGKTFAAMIAEMEAEHGIRFPADVSAQKDRRLLDLYALELRPVEGITEALRALPTPPHSVASNSPEERVAAALRVAGLAPWFGRITTFEHVANGKPEPDVFLASAERAGFRPEDCLVIEDSVTGVTAAVRAGCAVLGFTGTHPDPEAHARRLAAAGAQKTFTFMRDLPALAKTFL